MSSSSPRVIGTAGHVDHGKSTLIRALTGIDPDRLQEEKERGMTIDLGFAWLRLPSGQEVSIVDVPGHERFIKNMLAGVGGIDIALLVIAADEGVMPQTSEHLAILDLLQIETAVVALTKADLVDAEWLDLVRAEVEETLVGTTLVGAPIIAVSSTTGEGLDALRDELDRLLQNERHRRQTGWPRLPVDRVFTMAGFGTVVTGTLIDGEVRVGQEVAVLPSGRRARVRGLQSHRKRVESAPAGTRVAINLSGVGTEDIARGDVITTPGWLNATRVVDVRLRAVGDAPKPLAHNTQVTFHSGAAEAMARVGLLDRSELPPGETAWAQIRLDRPIAAVKGDLFVIRLPTPSITVGGGTIVDEHPKRHRRFQERTLAQLEVMEHGTPAEVLVQTLRSREPAELGELARRSAHTVEETVALVGPLLRVGDVVAINSSGRPPLGSTLLVSAQGWERLMMAAVQILAEYQAQHHLRRGMPREELRKKLGYDARTYAHVERELMARGEVVEDGPFVRLPKFQVRFSAEEEARASDLVARLIEAGIAVPARGELRTRYGVSDELLQALVDRGELAEVGSELLYPRQTCEEVVGRIRLLTAERGRVTVGDVRDSLHTSRKYALALLEHLDERRITKRIGDERVLV